MNRRQLLTGIASSLAATRVTGTELNTLAAALPKSHAAPVLHGPATWRTPAVARYEQLGFGVSYHFSMNTFTGDDYETGAVPASIYNPTHLDVRQWIRVAHDLGARYAVLTAKHMSGFCLWNSKGYDYDVAASRNKTDVVAAFVAACHEYGLRPGFYYCILDPHNEGKFDWNAPVSDKYFKLIRHHLTELAHTLSRDFLPTAGHLLENFPPAALAALSVNQALQSRLHGSDEPGLRSESPESGAHLRAGQLALRRD